MSDSQKSIKLMSALAHKDVDQDTILLINSGEVLTKEGIHGPIQKTGVGFGTGRHTSSRKELVEIPETKILDKKSTTNLDKTIVN